MSTELARQFVDTKVLVYADGSAGESIAGHSTSSNKVEPVHDAAAISRTMAAASITTTSVTSRLLALAAGRHDDSPILYPYACPSPRAERFDIPGREAENPLAKSAVLRPILPTQPQHS